MTNDLQKNNVPRIIYLPGWQNGADAIRPLAELVGGEFDIIDMMTMPGYPKSIGRLSDNLSDKITKPVWLVGHSFGGKIAMIIAAKYPHKVRGVIVIAGSNLGKLKYRMLRPAIWLAKKMGFSGARFQSSDYKNLSLNWKKIMRQTLSFNVIPYAWQIKCPASFIYGSEDKTTPPRLGRKLARAVDGGKFYQLDGYNHNTIISDGAFQVSAIIKKEINHLTN